MGSVYRAAFGYLFLVLMVRIVGRRPGRHMAPFDFVLIFFIGGLMLTGIVASDRSLTNAFVQVITVACVHYALTWMRRRWMWVSRVLDGSPLILLSHGQWRPETMRKMRVSEEDVKEAVRQMGMPNDREMSHAVLERNGAISVGRASRGR